MKLLVTICGLLVIFGAWGWQGLVVAFLLYCLFMNDGSGTKVYGRHVQIGRAARGHWW